MPAVRFPVEMVQGVPVVAVPEEIDVTSAAVLREALLEAAVRADGTFVADMTRTRFCDSAGLHVLAGAHRQTQAEGGELLLVAAEATMLRIFAITGLDRVIPTFTNLEDALATAEVAEDYEAVPDPA